MLTSVAQMTPHLVQQENTKIRAIGQAVSEPCLVHTHRKDLLFLFPVLEEGIAIRPKLPMKTLVYLVQRGHILLQTERSVNLANLGPLEINWKCINARNAQLAKLRMIQV